MAYRMTLSFGALLVAAAARQCGEGTCSEDNSPLGIAMLQLPIGQSQAPNRRSPVTDDVHAASGLQEHGRDLENTWSITARDKGISVGSCFSSWYALWLVVLVLLMVAVLVEAIVCRKTVRQQAQKIRALHTKLRVDRQIIRATEEHLRAVQRELNEDDARIYEAIKKRGYVLLDPATKQIQLKQNIEFALEKRGDDYVLAPEFASPAAAAKAREILLDVADLLKIFPSALVMIEGHTKCTNEELDDIAAEIALARAELVKNTLMSMGIEEFRMDAIGLPGGLGHNDHRVAMTIIGI